MDSTISVVSVNCQGLNGKQKRRDVFHFLKNKNYNIYLLQDTHLEDKIEHYVSAEWGYKAFFSSHASNSRGVAILFNNNFEFRIKTVYKGVGGNSLMVVVEIKQKEFLFVNIYGPNKDDPEFYNILTDKLKEIQYDNVIIGGDFNLVLDPSRDYHNYKNINNPRARDAVDHLTDELQLSDIWRELNPDCRRYTWRRSNPFQQARLDFFLVSDYVVPMVEDTDIECGYRTDHSMIILKLKLGKTIKHNTFWKFNSSLLKDKVYLDEINEEIVNVKRDYAASPYDRTEIDSIPLESLQLTIPDDVFLDFLLMKLRSKTISYATMKKKKSNQEEQKLQEDLRRLEQRVVKDEDTLNAINSKKEQLRLMREKRIEGVILRSRSRWISEGEKVTSYFCNLEKRHYISKCMGKLNDRHGNILQNQEDIMREVQGFYEQLYEKSNVEDCDINDLVTNVPYLDHEEAQSLEGEITLVEAGLALKNMQNNKSPGTDGFTAEFFKCFWQRIGTFVVRALNSAFRKGELSCTQRQGIITCLPKGDKPRNLIKNWRPISLLNVVYKIGSSCIANRLKIHLPQLINEDQTGFMKNRYIGDNLRLIYDIIAHLDESKSPGLLLNIDFEKAFDSVNWNFMFKALKAFGFQHGFCRWIETFYKNSKSCVIVNGQASQWFHINRGCRQGDPLSPYLFILCVEILALMIRENNDVKGIKINNVEHKLSQYADDTEFLLDGNRTSFETAINLLLKFGRVSGLKISIEKTSAVWLGSEKNSNVRYMTHFDMVWNPQKFKILGIWLTNDVKDCTDINYSEKLGEMKQLYKVWVKRQLTPLGRVAVLKSLILSKLTHLWLLLPNPPDDFIQTLQNICYKFVWQKKTDKINRKTAHKSIINGGMGIPNLHAFVMSLKLSWLRKLQSTNHKWKLVTMFNFPLIDNIHIHGPEIFAQFKKTNAFWTDVFNAYASFFYKVTRKNSGQLLAEPVFYNNNMQIGNTFIKDSGCAGKGVHCVAHFLSENGRFMSYADFKYKYNVNINYITFYGYRAAIATYIKKSGIVADNNKYLDTPICLKTLMSIHRGCKAYYDVFVNNATQPKCCQRWNDILNVQTNWNKCFLFLKKVSDVGMKWFQMKIIHRCIGTNIVLAKMGIAENDQCSFCTASRDDIAHLFWNCAVVQHFWGDFVNRMKEKCPNASNMKMSAALAILGYDQAIIIDDIAYFIILYAKQFLYKCKLNKCAPNMQALLRMLKYRYQIEEYISRKNMSYEKFVLDWQPYVALFCDEN